MSSLLVIGGSGFFGKSILDAYRRNLLSPWSIDKVIILSRNPLKSLELYPDLLGPSVELVCSDVSTCNSIPEADYVIHAAASTNISRYLSKPIKERENVLAGTRNYVDLAKKFHTDSKIVYVSSGAIYGKQPPDIEYLDENFHPGLINDMNSSKRDYAAAKRDSENLIQTLGAAGISVSIARCFAFIGRYLPLDQHFAAGNFIRNAINLEPIEIKASYPVYRTYMHPDDLVNWLMVLAENSNIFCPTYNVGSDEIVSLEKLAHMIASNFNVEVQSPKIYSQKADRYVPSINKAKSNLNLKLEYDLKKTITLTLEQVINEKGMRT